MNNDSNNLRSNLSQEAKILKFFNSNWMISSEGMMQNITLFRGSKGINILIIITNNPLTTPEKSNILHHSLTTNHPITIENFKILASCDKFDLRLLESLFIHKLKPSLNDQHSSTDLLIVN